jgi:hypothetical protein
MKSKNNRKIKIEERLSILTNKSEYNNNIKFDLCKSEKNKRQANRDIKVKRVRFSQVSKNDDESKLNFDINLEDINNIDKNKNKKNKNKKIKNKKDDLQKKIYHDDKVSDTENLFEQEFNEFEELKLKYTNLESEKIEMTNKYNLIKEDKLSLIEKIKYMESDDIKTKDE